MSEEAKAKIGAASRGRIFTAKHRRKISEAKRGIATHKGFHWSEETKANMRASQIGRPMPPEQYRKFLLGMQRRRPARPWLGKRMNMIAGANHYNWKGGITSVVMQIRHCLRYRQWRTAIFQRDDFTCVLCGSRGGDRHADHWPVTFADIIRHNNIASLDAALECPELWNVDNGRTLCKPCHHRRHSA